MSMEVVYNLMARGITDRKEISHKTGMNNRQVQAALNNLYKKGRLSIQEVLTVKGKDFYIYTINKQAPKANVFSGVSFIFNVGV